MFLLPAVCFIGRTDSNTQAVQDHAEGLGVYTGGLGPRVLECEGAHR